MLPMNRGLLLHAAMLALLLLSFTPARPALADDLPRQAVYICAWPDTPASVAALFHIPVGRILSANNLPDASQRLEAGQMLIIPSLDYYRGYLVRAEAAPGDTLSALALRSASTPGLLARLNRLTSPAELYLGRALVVPHQLVPAASLAAVFKENGSMLELAAQAGRSPYTPLLAGGSDFGRFRVPGAAVYLPASDAQPFSELLPGLIDLSINPLPLSTGGTLVVHAASSRPLPLRARLGTEPLAFFEQTPTLQVAIEGVPLGMKRGLTTLRLETTLPDGRISRLEQWVPVRVVDYGLDAPFTVAAELADPAVMAGENRQIQSIVQQRAEQRLWPGIFQPPTLFPDCITSTFGRRRSLNGSAYTYYHGGLDFCGGVGEKVLAAADGVVVYTGELPVHGNLLILSHGWGVYSGYAHLSKYSARVGQHVVAGEEVGRIGITGRVTGPHLHFEVWAGGVSVSPQEWLERSFP